MLRNCVLGGPADPPAQVDVVLLHPGLGVALLELPPHWTADAPGRLLRRLELARFAAIFPGHLPVAHRQVRRQDLAELPRLLDEAFAAQPPLSLPGGDAWMLAVRRALQEDAVTRPSPTGRPRGEGHAAGKGRPGLHGKPLVLAAATLGVGLATAVGIMLLPGPAPGPARPSEPAMAAHQPLSGTHAGGGGLPGAAPASSESPPPPGLPSEAPPALPPAPRLAARSAPEPERLPAAPGPQPLAQLGAAAAEPALDLPAALPARREPAGAAAEAATLPEAESRLWPSPDATTPAEAEASFPVRETRIEPARDAPAAVPHPAPRTDHPTVASEPALAPPAPAIPPAAAGDPAAAERPIEPAPAGMASLPPVRQQHAATAAAAPPPSTHAALLASLLRRGDALFELGDVSGARRFYERAAEGGDAEAALAMGRTFDPAVLAASGARGIQPDAAAAAAWYRRAAAMRASSTHGTLDRGANR
jgi:hypothetical protein